MSDHWLPNIRFFDTRFKVRKVGLDWTDLGLLKQSLIIRRRRNGRLWLGFDWAGYRTIDLFGRRL